MSLDDEARSAKGTVIAARIMLPRANCFRIETDRQALYSDGTSAWQYSPLRAVYTPYPKDDKGMYVPFAKGFELYSPPSKFKPQYTGVEETTFQDGRVIALIEEPQDAPNLKIRVFIDPTTWLPVGAEQRMLDAAWSGADCGQR